MVKAISFFLLIFAPVAFAQNADQPVAVVTCSSVEAGKVLIGGRTYTVFKSEQQRVNEPAKIVYQLQVSNASLGPNNDVATSITISGLSTVVVNQVGTLSLTADMGKTGYVVAHLKGNAKSFVDINVFKNDMNTAGVVELLCGKIKN